MDRLKSKNVVVTGAGNGIGESIATLFAKEGAKIAILARRTKEGNTVAESIIKAGGDAIFVSCDVSDPENVEDSVTEVISKYHSIDILINKIKHLQITYYYYMKLWNYYIILNNILI